jgi:hypothetical protein
MGTGEGEHGVNGDRGREASKERLLLGEGMGGHTHPSEPVISRAHTLYCKGAPHTPYPAHAPAPALPRRLPHPHTQQHPPPPLTASTSPHRCLRRPTPTRSAAPTTRRSTFPRSPGGCWLNSDRMRHPHATPQRRYSALGATPQRWRLSAARRRRAQRWSEHGLSHSEPLASRGHERSSTSTD